MKKLALALVCFASVAFFASCNPDVQNPEPSIQVYAEEGYVQNGDVIDVTEDTTYVNYGFVVASNTQTNKKLASLVVKVDDVEWANKDLTGETSFTYTDVVAYTFTRDQLLGTSVITAVITDEAGKTNTASIEISFNQPDVPILSAPIEWVRRGATVMDAEEMAIYGLQWTGTYKAPFATLKPIENATLYVCNGDDFEDITTMAEKSAYFANLAETATPVESYRNIDANQSADYNDMLAVVNGENLFVILIKHATIETITGVGTQITITGEAK